MKLVVRLLCSIRPNEEIESLTKHLVSVCLAVSDALGIATVSSGVAQAAPEKFISCQELNKRFDGGVANDKRLPHGW